MTPTTETCWCGSADLAPTAHAGYLVCRSCGTAKLRSELMPRDAAVVKDERSDLYGEQYWDEHQAAMGFPPLTERARIDLPERCQYWLSQVLLYAAPVGRALEIGCSHGAFVKLLSLAGFDAAGMEISPAIVSAARQRFGIPVHQGPLEATADLGKFDLIALFDVAEHLPDPKATMAQIASHLSPGGILVLQTPRHDGIADAKWPMYLPPEHTFLYSTTGLTRLLSSAGLSEVAFEPAIFPYDQFAFASRKPLVPRTESQVVESLTATPNGRMALCMQDLYRERVSDPERDLAANFGAKRLAKAAFRASLHSIRRRLHFGESATKRGP